MIGSVYVVGKEAPKVITKEMLSSMNPGTVMVDVSIDQGGCFETSKPTTHDNPTFLEKQCWLTIAVTAPEYFESGI